MAVAPLDLVFDMSMGSNSLIGMDITILNDTVVENRECFYAVINSSDTSVIVDPAMARVCIDDDDSTSQLPIILHGQCVLMASILHASNYAFFRIIVVFICLKINTEHLSLFGIYNA